MTTRIAGLGAGVLIVAALAIGVSRLALGSPAPAATRPSPAPSASPATATPAPNPLTIAAMRARAYPASSLTTVRSDGDLGGYVNTVVSFVSDGLTEYSLLSTPDGPRPAAGWPVVIVSHGYIDPRTYRTDDGSYAQFIATFARAGYMVLKPDFRGHGQSQGVAEGGYLSPVYTYDLLNLISTVKADPRVDRTRIGMFGHSLGGYEALRAMVISSDVKAVVLMSAVVGSLNDIFFNWHPVTSTPTAPPPPVQQKVAQSLIAAKGTPRTDPDFWNSASPINYVSFSSAAVQIDEDVNDSQVPKLFSDHLDAALRAAGTSVVDYQTYPGDDHQFTRNRTAVLVNIMAFYRAHL
ncbi:MAG TPA: alpha/beta fold hydrolase [Candidatus Deferrimicrobium sp.]|nr:alpha/beta fold hydrolase [Candidatus Deferrimicrobium sp.]